MPASPGRLVLLALLLAVVGRRRSSAKNYWTLTKKGFVASVRDPPFGMTAPHDLVKFLEQEKLSTRMGKFREDLVDKMRLMGERRQSDDPDVASKIVECESDCDVIALFAQIPGTFPSSLVSLREIGFTQRDIENMVELAYTGVRRSPRCDRYMDLPVSVAALDHVESIRNPSLLHHVPEPSIPAMTFSEWMTTADYGASIASKLKRNPRYWLMYTLASYYWRALGNSTEAVHCLRRAIYLVPRQFFVIPMLSMINVLGNGNRMADAALLADIALTFDDTLPPLAITSSYVYASTSQHKKALAVLDKILQLMSPFEPLHGFAETYRRSIRCHEKLESVLEMQHTTLKSLLEEIESYKALLEYGLTLMNNLRLTADLESRTESQMLYNYFKHGPSIPGLDCSVQMADSSKPRVVCQVVSQAYHAFTEKLKRNRTVCSVDEDERLFVDVDDDDDDEEGDDDDEPLEEVAGRPEGSESLLADWMDAVRQVQSKPVQLCRLSVPDAAPQVLVSPLNKGVRIRNYWKIYAKLKSDRAATAEPVCDDLQRTEAICDQRISGLLSATDIGQRLPPESELSQVLRHLFGPSVVTDFVDFVNTMLKYRIGPRWLMYNLAAAYWRVVGRPRQTLRCLCSSLADADGKIYEDVALAQAAVVAHGVGRTELAMALARSALDVDDSEPETHHLLGYLYAKDGQYDLALHHLNVSVQLQPASRFQVVLLYKAVQLLSRAASVESHRHDGTKDDDQQRCDANDLLGDEFDSLFVDSVSDEYQPAMLLSDGSFVVAPSDELAWVNADAERSDALLMHATEEDITPDAAPADEARRNATHHGRDTAHSPNNDSPMPKLLPDVAVNILKEDLVGAEPLHNETQCRQWVKEVNFDLGITVWLSTQAKGINVAEHIDFKRPVPVDQLEPICPSNFAGNMWTMDHLAGYMRRMDDGKLKPRAGLSDVFVRLNPYSVESVSTIASRIAEAINTSKGGDDSIWVATLVASLYWRIVGNCSMAIDCLRHSIAYAPVEFKDIGLINLANTYERNGYYTSALIAASVALRLSPNLVIVHFALANIFVALNDFERALAFFHSTLLLQASFEPAWERARALQCMRWYNIA